MRQVKVGSTSEFADPGRKIVAFEHFEVGVFKLDREFFAYLNQCPHAGGPACQGKMIAKVEEIIADDRTSQGMMFSKTKMHGLPLARLRVRHSHRRSSREPAGSPPKNSDQCVGRRRDY